MEWIFLIVATIILDIVQVILEFFVIGIILNRIIDIVVGFCLPIYFWLRGVGMNDWKRWLAFLGGFGLEEVGLGGDDGLPLWTAEVAVVWLTVVVEKRVAKQMQKHPILSKAVGVVQQINAPLNKDGKRLPRSSVSPLNQNGRKRDALHC
jgi:hypothetical protein